MRAGDPLELLELLRSDGCGVLVDPDGVLLFTAPPAWVRLVSRASWQLLVAVLRGAEGHKYGRKVVNGKPRCKVLRHVWARCDVCGAGIMRQRSAGPRRCAMTPSCMGKHRL
jgi:hypothetical protein